MARSEGWYRVTLHQFNKELETDADYFDEWVFYDGNDWHYHEYKERCRVIKVLKKE